jgi:hypothetical protein
MVAIVEATTAEVINTNAADWANFIITGPCNLTIV